MPANRRVLLAAIFATILAQMIVSAVISEYNVHPDERSHVTTADYYLHWWLPPAAGDSRILSSLSAYGHSYHYSLTPAYFLAGKAVAPIQDLIRYPFVGFRLFNVALFAILLGLALRHRDETFAVLLLLCPAQVWYLFSCFNDDALALFSCLLCCWQVMHPGAAGARFLAARDWRTSRRGALILGLILAMILLSKKNFHIFLVFLGGYAVWTIVFAADLGRARRLAAKWAVVAMAMVCLAWPRYALDDWINDPEAPGNRGLSKWQRAREVTEAYATTGFKPSRFGTEDAYPGLRMREQGIPFRDLFRMRWHEITFMSSVGVYGYVSIYSSVAFYLAILIAYVSLMATLIVLVFRHGKRRDQLFLLACFMSCAAIVLASAYHSWTVDFEPQGRYLFPGIGIVFLGLMHLKPLIPTRILWRYGILIWLLSCYSFLFTGLRLIPKLSG